MLWGEAALACVRGAKRRVRMFAVIAECGGQMTTVMRHTHLFLQNLQGQLLIALLLLKRLLPQRVQLLD